MTDNRIEDEVYLNHREILKLEKEGLIGKSLREPPKPKHIDKPMTPQTDLARTCYKVWRQFINQGSPDNFDFSIHIKMINDKYNALYEPLPPETSINFNKSRMTNFITNFLIRQQHGNSRPELVANYTVENSDRVIAKAQLLKCHQPEVAEIDRLTNIGIDLRAEVVAAHRATEQARADERKKIVAEMMAHVKAESGLPPRWVADLIAKLQKGELEGVIGGFYEG